MAVAGGGTRVVELARRSASSISAGDNPLLSKNDTFFDSGLEATCASIKNFTAFSTSGLIEPVSPLESVLIGMGD